MRPDRASAHLADSVLARLFQEAPRAFVVLNEARRIVAINAAAEQMFGYDNDELLGRPSDLLAGANAHLVANERAAARGETGRTTRVPGRRRDNSEFLAEATSAIVETEAGPLNFVVVRDATEDVNTEQARDRDDTEAERVRLEAERVRLIAERTRLAAEREKAAAEHRRLAADRQRLKTEAALLTAEDQLHQAHRMESLGQLAGGVAHDFNNLLAVIGNYASFVGEELTKARDLDGAERWAGPLADIGEIQNAAIRAGRLTKQLLSFARRESVDRKPMNLSAEVAAMEQILQRAIGVHVALNLKLAPSLSDVRADAGQLEQIVFNLGINARDSMLGGGVLTIETSCTEDGDELGDGVPAGAYVRLRVSDTGTGMSPEVKARALEPFFSTKPDGEGSGLGLATVDEIVRQSDGHLSISSTVGEGTVITVLFPAQTSTFASDAIGRPRAAMPATGGNETVLLVEDEDAMREANAPDPESERLPRLNGLWGR